MITIQQFFEHFEGKDWFTAIASVVAILVSGAAVTYNRRANHLNETAQPARFVAQWHVHIDDRPLTLLTLVNKGDGIADRLTVTMPYDPNHILGLRGTIQEPVRPGETAQFYVDMVDTFRTQSQSSKFDLALQWFDVWGKPRSQRIAARDIAWGAESSVGMADHSPTETPDEASGLYDLAPLWRALAGQPRWRRRRRNAPAQDFR